MWFLDTMYVLVAKVSDVDEDGLRKFCDARGFAPLRADTIPMLCHALLHQRLQADHDALCEDVVANDVVDALSGGTGCGELERASASYLLLKEFGKVDVQAPVPQREEEMAV